MPKPVPKELLMDEELIGFVKLSDKQTMRRANSAKITKPTPTNDRKPRARE